MSRTLADRSRPPENERWTDRMRTTPVRIAVRTRWLYSDYDPTILVPQGRTRHPFSRGGDVVSSDVPNPYPHMQGIADHVHRAVEAFGDDKDLIIEVRLAEPHSEVHAETLRIHSMTNGPHAVNDKRDGSYVC